MVDFGQSGAFGGFLAAQQMRNEELKTEVERGQLGIQLQDLAQKRQRMMLDMAQGIATQIDATVKGLEAQLYREPPVNLAPDMKLTELVNDLAARKTQITRILTGNDELAAQEGRGVVQLLTRAATAERQQILSAGQGIFTTGPDGKPQLKAAMPTAPSDFERRVGIARRLGASDEEIRQMAVGGGRDSASRFRPLGPYINDSGKQIGEGVFDGQTGKTMLRVGEELRPMPAGAKAVTETSQTRNALTGEQFLKLADEVREAEQSVRAMERYWKNIDNANQGFERLADQFSAAMKTLFGKALDSPQEFNAMLARGELQGLIGRFRKEVVGGGVMTEQDALRVVMRLGGNPDAWQNKSVVAGLLKEVLRDKIEDYNDRLVPGYNQQLKESPRGAGFKEKKPMEVDLEKMFGGTDAAKEEKPSGRPAPPAVGTVRKGYRFKGGDPSQQSNWEKVEKVN